MNPRSAKQKGLKFERKMEQLLEQMQFVQCRKQPGSGIYQHFPHDLDIRLGELHLIAECKKHKNPSATYERWMGKAQLLFLEANHGDPRVYMDVHVLVSMLCEAHDLGAQCLNNQKDESRGSSSIAAPAMPRTTDERLNPSSGDGTSPSEAGATLATTGSSTKGAT